MLSIVHNKKSKGNNKKMGDSRNSLYNNYRYFRSPNKKADKRPSSKRPKLISAFIFILLGSVFCLYYFYFDLNISQIFVKRFRSLTGSRDLTQKNVDFKNVFGDQMCAPPDGQNELRQLRHYWSWYFNKTGNVPKIQYNANNSGFEYDINDISSLGMDQSFLLLNLRETYLQNATFGGASFRATVTSQSKGANHLKMCQVTDYFTGSYHICCPLTPDACNIIEVLLMYTNFEAFSDNLYTSPLLRKLWSIDHCSRNKTPSVSKYNSIHVDNSNTSNEDNHNNAVSKSNIYENEREDGNITDYKICSNAPNSDTPGHWVQISGQWRWLHDQNGSCLMKMISSQNLTKCLMGMTSLNLFGASHMRYNFDYLAAHLPGTWPKLPRKHGSVKFGHVNFRGVDYATHLAEELLEIQTSFKGKNITNSDVVVIQTGAWDLAYKKFSDFMIKRLPLALHSLANLRRAWSKARIVWLNIIAYPQNDHLHRGKRNNFSIAAMNAYLRPLIKKLGVVYSDVFQVTVSRNFDTVFANHYICPHTIKNPEVGYVGLHALHLTLGQLCRPYL